MVIHGFTNVLLCFTIYGHTIFLCSTLALYMWKRWLTRSSLFSRLIRFHRLWCSLFWCCEVDGVEEHLRTSAATGATAPEIFCHLRDFELVMLRWPQSQMIQITTMIEDLKSFHQELEGGKPRKTPILLSYWCGQSACKTSCKCRGSIVGEVADGCCAWELPLRCRSFVAGVLQEQCSWHVKKINNSKTDQFLAISRVAWQMLRIWSSTVNM